MNYSQLFFFLLALTRSHTLNLDEEWQNWKTQHNKEYSSEQEELLRRNIWDERRKYVDNHSNRADVTFTVALNHMADQIPSAGHTPEEWQLETREELAINDIRLGKNVIWQPPPPQSFDWRNKGVISAVRNQGEMGSSLAVAATECVESLNAIHHGYNLQLLSVQECSDCCAKQPSFGTAIFHCIHNIGGLCGIADYLYRDGHCHNNTVTPSAQIAGGRSVPKGREDILQDILLGQPILAVIDASQTSFQLYRDGVYNEPHCSSTRLNHAVQIVGYGLSNGQEYWIVKNSWGENWGMNGYVLMSKNKNNQCGIASSAAYPIAEQ